VRLYLDAVPLPENILVDEVIVLGWWEPDEFSRSFAGSGFEVTERHVASDLPVIRLRSPRPRRLRQSALARTLGDIRLLLYEASPSIDASVKR
jgi:hypothetical protein